MLNKLKLINAAIMPQDGHFTRETIDHEMFCEEIRVADKHEGIESFIGYPQNARLIQTWTGVDVEVSRKQLTALEPGDRMLVMALVYRPDVEDKGKLVNPEDFMFLQIEYHGKLK